MDPVTISSLLAAAGSQKSKDRFPITNVGNDGEEGFPLPACPGKNFVGMTI